jgi:regulator of protease activity HflC (stomatin/prohibitin superfamily)
MIVVRVVVALLLVVLAGLVLSVRILKQYERAVIFRLGRVRVGACWPGLIVFVPFVDRVHRVSLRIITMPIRRGGGAQRRAGDTATAPGRRRATMMSPLWGQGPL